MPTTIAATPYPTVDLFPITSSLYQRITDQNTTLLVKIREVTLLTLGYLTLTLPIMELFIFVGRSIKNGVKHHPAVSRVVNHAVNRCKSTRNIDKLKNFAGRLRKASWQSKTLVIFSIAMPIIFYSVSLTNPYLKLIDRELCNKIGICKISVAPYITVSLVSLLYVGVFHGTWVRRFKDVVVNKFQGDAA